MTKCRFGPCRFTTVAHELVVGIGSQTISTSRLGNQERVVGITTVFSSDGKYLLDDRTAAVPYDQYKDELFKSRSRSIENVRRIDFCRAVFDETNKGVRQGSGLKGVCAPDRGLTMALGDGESLLCLTGPRDLKQARHGMPQPTLLKLHRRSTFRDMTYF